MLNHPNRENYRKASEGPTAGRPPNKRSVRILTAIVLLGSGTILNMAWMGFNSEAQFSLQRGLDDELASTLPKLSTSLNNIMTSSRSYMRHSHNDAIVPTDGTTIASLTRPISSIAQPNNNVVDAEDLSRSSSHTTSILESSPRIEGRPALSHGNHSIISLHDLTRSPPYGSIECPSIYMVPIYDRIVEEYSTIPDNNSTTRPRNTTLDSSSSSYSSSRKIPRIIHVSFNQRCIPQEMATSIEKWRDALPDHSIYFHDDDAVDRLLQLGWDEFPDLHRLLACVQFKGAMKIDIWRVLVLYKYGGVYTDIDNWPMQNFTMTTIHPQDTFFSLSDAKDRPSQWLFAMEPRHPIGSYAVWEIMNRLKRVKNIAKPHVVQITGPHTLLSAYRKFFNRKLSTIEERSHVHKISRSESGTYAAGSLGGTYQNNIVFEGVTMTIREKTELISGIEHWPKQVKNNTLPYQGSCLDYIALLDSQNPNWTIPKVTP
jgi:mannosyltransferase OCH1-like enzyme